MPLSSIGDAQGMRSALEQILQLYRIVLGRNADPNGLATYFKRLLMGDPLAEIVSAVIESEEFRATNGGVLEDSVDSVLELYATAYGTEYTERVRKRHGEGLRLIPGLGSKLAAVIEAEPAPCDIPSERMPAGSVRNDSEGYRIWRIWREQHSTASLAAARAAGGRLLWRPLLSLIVLVDRWEGWRFDRLVASVVEQTYEPIELVIVGRPNWAVSAVARRYARQDRRIRFVRPETSRRAAWLAAALDTVDGDFVALIGPDDALAAVAALQVARAINETDAVGLVYADEDVIDRRGRRTKPWFKTEWDYEAVLADDQIGRPAFIRKSLMKEMAKGASTVRPGWEYDLLLRVTETLKPDQIRRAKGILYHRGRGGEKRGRALALTRRSAVEAHLARTGQVGCGVELSGMVLRVTRPASRACAARLHCNPNPG